MREPDGGKYSPCGDKRLKSRHRECLENAAPYISARPRQPAREKGNIDNISKNKRVSCLSFGVLPTANFAVWVMCRRHRRSIGRHHAVTSAKSCWRKCASYSAKTRVTSAGNEATRCSKRMRKINRISKYSGARHRRNILPILLSNIVNHRASINVSHHHRRGNLLAAKYSAISKASPARRILV